MPNVSPLDLTGQRFGRLVVLSYAGHSTRGKRLWLCQCDCGQQKRADQSSMKQGRTKSCGCLQIETMRHASACRLAQKGPYSIPVKKLCRGCMTVKPAADFSVSKSNGYLRSRCDECRRAYNRAYGARHSPSPRLWHQYRLRKTDFDRMLAEQGGKCKLCGTDDPGKGRARFVVDHCHQTGRVRGLLCERCNTRLGRLGDTPQALQQHLEQIQRLLDYTMGRL